MAKLKPLLTVVFYGVKYPVFIVPDTHPEVNDATAEHVNGGLWGCVLPDEHEIYLNEELTEEGRRAVLVHELQHLIEYWIPICYKDGAATDAGADGITDLISKGWLYIIRHNPKLLGYLNYKR